MITLVEAIIGLGVILGIAGYVGKKFSFPALSEPQGLLGDMEEHYLTYLDKQKALFLLEQEKLEKLPQNDTAQTQEQSALPQSSAQINAIIDDILVILKPEIDGLAGKINAGTFTAGKAAEKLRVFRHLAPIAEAFVERRKSTGEHLSERDEEKLYAAVKDALRADLQERIINWKLGEI